jgi:hypothetical protein
MQTRNEEGSMDAAGDNGTFRELDRRSGDGFEVALLWDPDRNKTFVVVVDEQEDEFLRIDVEADRALDAFHHPYIYAVRQNARKALV